MNLYVFRYIDFLCRVLSTAEIGLLKAFDPQVGGGSPSANNISGNSSENNVNNSNGFGHGATNSILNDAEINLKHLRKISNAPMIPTEKLSYLFGVWRMDGDAQNKG